MKTIQTGSTERELQHILPLNRCLRIFFNDAVRVSLTNPLQALFFLRMVRWQRHAARTRLDLQETGINVPPILIFSITNRCNLHCKGCYHHALRGLARDEVSTEKMLNIVSQARELGISFIVLAGGEPLVRYEILDVAAAYPDVLFFMFTNGLLISEDVERKLKTTRNLVPIISLEGNAGDTDGRRGTGIYRRLQNTVEELKRNHIFFGISFTVTRFNLGTLADENFVRTLVNQGCRTFMFVEYTPVDNATSNWVLTDEMRKKLVETVSAYRRRFPALFVLVPEDEKQFGGCLSAGRGFVHVNAQGDLEPCPFIPYSDTSLLDTSLKEALKSRFLKAIRQNQDLQEENTGCALWEKKAWLESLLYTDHAENKEDSQMTGSITNLVK